MMATTRAFIIAVVIIKVSSISQGAMLLIVEVEPVVAIEHLLQECSRHQPGSQKLKVMVLMLQVTQKGHRIQVDLFPI